MDISRTISPLSLHMLWSDGVCCEPTFLSNHQHRFTTEDRHSTRVVKEHWSPWKVHRLVPIVDQIRRNLFYQCIILIHPVQLQICDMINFNFLTPLSHNFKMLHFYANPITIGYLVTELWRVWQCQTIYIK